MIEALPGAAVCPGYKFVDERGGWELELYHMQVAAAKHRNLTAGGAAKRKSTEQATAASLKKHRLAVSSSDVSLFRSHKPRI